MEDKDVVLVKNLEEEFEIELYGTITEESTQPILQQLKMIKEKKGGVTMTYIGIIFSMIGIAICLKALLKLK